MTSAMTSTEMPPADVRYVALLARRGAAAAERMGEIAGIVQRAGMPPAAGRFVLFGDDVPALSVPASRFAEPDPDVLARAVRQSGAALILMPDDGWARASAVALALRLGALCLTGVTALERRPDGWIVHRRSHGGRVDAHFALGWRPAVLTVARGVEPAAVDASTIALATLPAEPPTALPEWLEAAHFEPATASAGLEQADYVLVAGRGAGSRVNVARLAVVANRLGLAFAVSRPVAMNAWAPMHRLAGVSGAMLKPRLAILAGVSGAPALMAAVARSRTIVAINTDPDAPVFRAADVGIVGDCLSLLEAFAESRQTEVVPPGSNSA